MPDSIDRRIALRRPELASALRGVYPDHADEVVDELVRRARAAADARPHRLRRRDDDRPVSSGWHLEPERVGYTTDVDRFGGDLDGVRRRLDHLSALGVDTVHLRSVDERIGTDDDLDRLVAAMHDRSMSLCLDLAVDHTTDDHDWAIAARDGSERHRALFHTFPDRTEPDRFEQALPGSSFTWSAELERWVWTTFGASRWDLDWSNPDVMLEMSDVVLALANRGVDMLRLGAIAFTWKRLGTTCRHQPEAHLIAQALRAVLAIAAPSVVLVADAPGAPEEIVGYLGAHRVERHECELADHDQLMVQGWSMLASQRADLARVAVGRVPSVPHGSSWFTHVRSGGDIGWSIADDDATAVGLSGAAHREYLAEFYRGDFWQSWARGTASGTSSGDERTGGTTASLCGIAAAVEDDDPAALDVALARFQLLHAIAFGFGGIPMIRMGDEIAQSDDRGRPGVPDRSDTVAGRAWAGVRALVEARRACPHLQDGPVHVSTFDTGSTAVFAWHRHHRRYGDFIGLANVGVGVALVYDHPDMGARPGGPQVVDRLAPGQPDVWRLDPLQVRWLTLDDPLPPVP